MGANDKAEATYHGEEYTPQLIDLRVAYRFMEADLMMDPDSKPHDPVLMAESDAEFDRLINRVRAEAKAEALREAAEYAVEWVGVVGDGQLVDLKTETEYDDTAEWLRDRANQYRGGSE